MQQNDLCGIRNIFSGNMHQIVSQRWRVLQRHLAAAAGAPRPRLPVLSSSAEDRIPHLWNRSRGYAGRACWQQASALWHGYMQRADKVVLRVHILLRSQHTRATRPVLAVGGPDSAPFSYSGGPVRGAALTRLGAAVFASIRPLNPPANRFQLFRITGDGSCMLRAVVVQVSSLYRHKDHCSTHSVLRGS
jgi:hypothetical protein